MSSVIYLKIFLIRNFLKLKGQRVFVENKDYRKAYLHLLDFAINFNNLIESKQQRIFLLNILFQSEKDRGLLLQESLYKSFLYTKKIQY